MSSVARVVAVPALDAEFRMSPFITDVVQSAAKLGADTLLVDAIREKFIQNQVTLTRDELVGTWIDESLFNMSSNDVLVLCGAESARHALDALGKLPRFKKDDALHVKGLVCVGALPSGAGKVCARPRALIAQHAADLAAMAAWEATEHGVCYVVPGDASCLARAHEPVINGHVAHLLGDALACSLKFHKMHGLGNDFIVVEEETHAHVFHPHVAKRLCARGLAIGADGMLQVGVAHDTGNHARFEHINMDGSISTMCGNGIRAFAKYVYDRKMFGITSETKRLLIETPSGVKSVEVETGADDRVVSVKVDMGAPVLSRALVPMTGGGGGEGRVLNEHYTVPVTGHVYSTLCVARVGVPHAALWIDSIAAARVLDDGPHILADSKTWPESLNVTFVERVDAQAVRMRFFERGAGVTLACGTGACAAVATGVLTGRLAANVPVVCETPGGQLKVTCVVEGDNVKTIFMDGPAAMVYTARSEIHDL